MAWAAVLAVGAFDASHAQAGHTHDYTEYPPPPRLSATTPASPANENLPRVFGAAQRRSTIRVYANHNCSNRRVARGSAKRLATEGISVAVPDDSITRLSATATGRDGNRSHCSNSLAYTEDSTPPDTQVESGPSAIGFDPTPTFKLASNERASFKCRLDPSRFRPCAPLRTYGELPPGEYRFRARAIDEARNRDPSPAQWTFTVGSEDPPNILLIVTDDQRAIGPMQEMPRTYDFFNEGGTTFDHAYATTPMCCPSRASIFSGRYAHNHGITVNDGTGFDASQTWQRYLDDGGYYTGIIGKYLNEVPTGSASYFDYRRGWNYGDPDDARKLAAYGHIFLDHAEAQDARPWALVAAPHSPHPPFNVQPLNPRPIPPWHQPLSFGEEDLSDKHRSIRVSAESWNPATADADRVGQLTELQATDEAIGSIIDGLRAFGEGRDTLAIFTSDNGYLWGEHQLRGKGRPYPEGTGIPLYVRWRGHLPAGAVSHALAANIDIAPTIFGAVALQPDYPLDGRPLLRSAPRDWLFLESATFGDRWWSYLTPTRQYILWQNGWVEDYDLVADPFQLTANQRVVPRIAAAINAARSCVGSSCP